MALLISFIVLLLLSASGPAASQHRYVVPYASPYASPDSPKPSAGWPCKGICTDEEILRYGIVVDTGRCSGYTGHREKTFYQRVPSNCEGSLWMD